MNIVRRAFEDDADSASLISGAGRSSVLGSDSKGSLCCSFKGTLDSRTDKKVSAQGSQTMILFALCRKPCFEGNHAFYNITIGQGTPFLATDYLSKISFSNCILLVLSLRN